jgi:hypothetical protein
MFNRARSYSSEVVRRAGSRAALALVLFVFMALLGAAKAAAASGSSASSVQVTAASTHTAATALAVSFPGSTTAGDVILVAFDYNPTATATGVTDSQGNLFSLVGSQLTSPGGSRSVVYYANKIKGGADTVTVHLSAASSCIEVYLSEYHGLNATSPIDNHAGASGSTAAVSSGAASTTVAGDIIFGYCLGDSSCTAGAGFTTRSSMDGNLMEDMVAGKAGAYAATGSASSTWSMQMVALKPAVASTVTLSASSLTFGAEPVTLAAPTQAVTLTNTGNVALSISNISFTGANAADFSQANTCNSSVAAGAKCTIVVLFTPSAAGARAASLSIADNAGNGAQTVAVAGTGSHDVLLSWNASPSAGIAGYNVYRGTTSGAESSTPLNATPISGTTFTDANVTDGSTYYYVVTAVAANGTTHSAQSNQASALVP